MNIPKLSLPFLVFAAVLAMLVVDGARAQIGTTQTMQPTTSVDRSFDPAPKDCSEVRWSQAALRAYPSIAEACQDVEERNGKNYVKLEGVVESVENEGNRIRVDFEDGEPLTFTPAPQTVLYLDGERTSFSEVRDGMRLNFYVPEDRLQAELQPNPTRMAFIIFPLVVPPADIPESQQMAQSDQTRSDRERNQQSAMNTLPATASPWPLIGGGGAVLLILGAAMTLRRRRGNAR